MNKYPHQQFLLVLQLSSGNFSLIHRYFFVVYFTIKAWYKVWYKIGLKSVFSLTLFEIRQNSRSF